MSVATYFAGKKAGQSYIDGVLVTEENHDALVAKNMRTAVLLEIHEIINSMPFRWAGIKNLPERDRIISILELTKEQIING